MPYSKLYVLQREKGSKAPAPQFPFREEDDDGGALVRQGTKGRGLLQRRGSKVCLLSFHEMPTGK